MKIISLNCWGGKLYEPLMAFIREQALTTDVFCFQEFVYGERAGTDVGGIRANLSVEVQAVLPDFELYRDPTPHGYPFCGEMPSEDVKFGEAIFVRKSLKVTEHGELLTVPVEHPVRKDPLTLPTGRFQFVALDTDRGPLTVGNIHGIWQKEGKDDTPERMIQSQFLIDFFAGRKGGKFLCGDFNLRPDNIAVTMIEEDGGFVGLIRKFGVRTTRNAEYKNMEQFKDYIADYMFVSPDIEVQSFEVLPGIVSDHQALRATIA